MKMGASLPAYRTFTLDELKEATDCFDSSSFMCDASHGQVCISNFIRSIGLKDQVSLHFDDVAIRLTYLF